MSRPGRALTVEAGEAGVLRVDQRVLAELVRRAVAAVPRCRPVGVLVDLVDPALDVGAAGDRVGALRLDVAVGYDADVREVAEGARAAAAGAVRGLLGHGCPVDVVVVDVDRG